MTGAASSAAPSAEWTLLLYMVAVKGGLLEAETRLLNALAGASSSAALNVVYEISSANETTRGRIRREHGRHEVLFAGPRVNAASPASIASFVDWATGAFPSRFTALVIKGHGGGLDRPPTSGLPGEAGGAVPPPESPPSGVALPFEILDDEVTNQYLGVRDLRTALAGTRLGRVDVCGLDACDMALLEVAYEVREVTSYLVAAQSTESSTAWPYVQSIAALSSGRDIGPRALATLMATANPAARLAAMELGWAEPLASSLDRIANILTKILWATPKIVDGVRSVLTSFGVENQYVDLKQLLTALKNVIPERALLPASALLERLCFAKVPMVLSGAVDAGGVSLFFPRRSGSTYLGSYGGLEFARRNRWAGFVSEFCFRSPGS